MKYLTALSVLLIASGSFAGVCVAQVNPAFAGFTSNATMTVVNYPQLDAVGGLPPSSGTISGSVYNRGSCSIIKTRQKGDFILANGTKGSITFGGYAFSGTTSVNFAQNGILDGTLIDLILDVDLSPDIDLDIWWTVSKSSPTCGFICSSYTYHYNNVTCAGTASTTGSTTTTTPTTTTGSKTSTTQ
ncbi:hypothetical protein C8F04DRAFT_1204099 [Mycena alexandri]|uniref:Uncharacterized protein n=1 Tax=Mycena alexandri TaxID=1745969 RepID=A0AAD6WKU6_9AGAR|nr:hypothetical protein C8F04DRAFT_1204099 [Mycena alexandri]